MKMRDIHGQQGVETHRGYNELASRRFWTRILGRHVSQQRFGTRECRGMNQLDMDNWPLLLKLNERHLFCGTRPIPHSVNNFFFPSRHEHNHWLFYYITSLNGQVHTHTKNVSLEEARGDHEDTWVRIQPYKECCIHKMKVAMVQEISLEFLSD